MTMVGACGHPHDAGPCASYRCGCEAPRYQTIDTVQRDIANSLSKLAQDQRKRIEELTAERDRYKKALEGIEHELVCAFGEYLDKAGKESVAAELWRLVNEGFGRVRDSAESRKETP